MKHHIPLQILDESECPEIFTIAQSESESQSLQPVDQIATHSSPLFGYSDTSGLSTLFIPVPVAQIYTLDEFKVGVRLALMILGPNSPEIPNDGDQWYHELIARLAREPDGAHVLSFNEKQDWAVKLWQQIETSGALTPDEVFMQAARDRLSLPDSSWFQRASTTSNLFILNSGIKKTG